MTEQDAYEFLNIQVDKESLHPEVCRKMEELLTGGGEKEYSSEGDEVFSETFR